MDAFKEVNLLVSGVRSLLTKPFRQGVVNMALIIKHFLDQRLHEWSQRFLQSHGIITYQVSKRANESC